MDWNFLTLVEKTYALTGPLLYTNMRNSIQFIRTQYQQCAISAFSHFLSGKPAILFFSQTIQTCSRPFLLLMLDWELKSTTLFPLGWHHLIMGIGPCQYSPRLTSKLIPDLHQMISCFVVQIYFKIGQHIISDRPKLNCEDDTQNAGCPVYWQGVSRQFLRYGHYPPNLHYYLY